MCVLGPLVYGAAPYEDWRVWEIGVFISYIMALVIISLLAKSIYDIRKALIKRPGTVFNTTNVLYHLISFFMVFIIGTVVIFDLLEGKPGIIFREKDVRWFFRGQIIFEVCYFISTIFLIKIFNELVNQCVSTTAISVDSENGDDLSFEDE